MNELTVFENNEFGKVRTTTIDGEVYFCGKDVATALGYAIPSKAINTHCKGVSKMEAPTKSGIQTMLFIPEGDVYRLIVHSKLPSAERFEKWVFDEVLPQIRRTGMYANAIAYVQSPQFLIDVAHQLQADQEVIETLQETVEELAPKASYCDIILGTDDLIPITLIAKDYGKTAQWLNKYLVEKGVQYKVDKTYVLNKKYADEGYTGSKTYSYFDFFNLYHCSIQMYWTQRGRLFIYNLLKEDGIVPIMEREVA